MRVVIDCFKLVKGYGKSIGIYQLALNLTKNLVLEKRRSLDDTVKTSEIIVIGNRYNRDGFCIDGVRFIEITGIDPLNKLHCLVWELFLVSLKCKKLNADRVIFPRGYCALTHPVKDIVIIHDMIPFYYHKVFPLFFNKIENTYIMSRLKRSACDCDRIITISEASKKDIQKYTNVSSDKIRVINNGYDPIEGEKRKIKDAYTYIVTVTSLLPHKNAKGMLESYKEYCKITKEPLDLVIIGLKDTDIVTLPDDVKARVTCYKYIEDDQELYRVIANGTVFLFLSLIEGFGFPPIEAMRSGVPVICSDASSLPEVVGEAAVLVDPQDPQEIARSLDDLIRDENKRKRLVEAGFINCQRFSWDVISKQYWDAILQ